MAFHCETRYRSKLRKLAESAYKHRTSHNLEKTVKVDVAPTIGQQLLSDMHQIFISTGISKLKTVRLLSILCADSSKRWATFCNGKMLNARTLTTLLKEFGLHSKDIRFNKRVFKGFNRQTTVEAQQKYGG